MTVPSSTIFCGDALAELRKAPDGVARTCVTSPPYWGLRDYGTARWDGGDPECDHQRAIPQHERSSSTLVNPSGQHPFVPFKGDCGKCGARRIDSQIGLEQTPDEYVAKLVTVFRELRRVLRDDGTLWMNLGDSYSAASGGGQGKNSAFLDRTAARIGVRKQKLDKTNAAGLKPKDLVGVPWRVAFALQADGWTLRQDVIWAKPNPMPESVRDRCTKAHEYVFLLSKSSRYYYDAKAIAERAVTAGAEDSFARPSRVRARGHMTGGVATGNEGSGAAWVVPAVRNARSVWTIPTRPYRGAHFATFPPALVERCLRATSAPGDLVVDPFAGAGTTGLVARQLGRRFVGIDLNPEYCAMARARIAAGSGR